LLLNSLDKANCSPRFVAGDVRQDALQVFKRLWANTNLT
jgi:hypothetical protein